MTVTVTFDLDDKAILESGDLVQVIAVGADATPPIINDKTGYQFLEWDAPLTNIQQDTTITALFKPDTNVFAICELLGDKVKANADVIAYCDDKFDVQPNIYIGFDSNKLPESGSDPFIVISPNTRQDTNKQHYEHGIMLAVVCRDDTKSTASKITKHEGYRTIADFENVVFNAIEETLSDINIYYDLMRWGASNYECFYPEYHASRELTIVSGL